MDFTIICNCSLDGSSLDKSKHNTQLSWSVVFTISSSITDINRITQSHDYSGQQINMITI